MHCTRALLARVGVLAFVLLVFVGHADAAVKQVSAGDRKHSSNGPMFVRAQLHVPRQTASQTPTPTTTATIGATPTATIASSPSGGIPMAAVAGAIAGGLVFLGLVVIGLYLRMKSNRKRVTGGTTALERSISGMRRKASYTDSAGYSGVARPRSALLLGSPVVDKPNGPSVESVASVVSEVR